jgi:DNA-binding transcriptional LysR family regulator
VKPQLELANFDLIRSLVQAGLGYTILTQPLNGTPPHWSSDVVAVPIADPLPPLTIVLAHRRGLRLTRRAEAFRELCMSRGQELLGYSRSDS